MRKSGEEKIDYNDLGLKLEIYVNLIILTSTSPREAIEADIYGT